MSRAPTETQRALAQAVIAGLAPLRAAPPMSLSRWAAKHFKLSAESSHKQGQWEAYPFQTGWMDAFSNDDIQEVTVRKAKRVGYTKTLVAFVAYNAAHRRRKQALWQPTDDDRDSFVKSEVDPMLRDVAAMRPVLLGGKEDTLKLKTFMGSVLHTLGGKAARAYRRITVAAAMLDEVDGFDQSIEKAGDPITLARGRLEGAPFPKLIAGSTPRVKGLSHVEYRETNAQCLMRYHVTCPHCQAEHPLIWNAKSDHGLRWDAADPASVRHVCPHCRGSLSQGDYLAVYGRGAWVSDCGAWRYGQDELWRNDRGELIKPPAHVAFHIWTAYSPQRLWADIVREFLEANAKAKAGDNGPLAVFVNETLGDLWEEAFEKADENALQRRAEDYALFTVPAGGLVLVAGIDVQDNRFEVVTWAIGRGEEMWACDYSVIDANPADEREWAEKLDAYLETPFTHANGHTMRIEAAAVDTGGHFTHQAYNYARMRERRRVFAIKGAERPGQPVKGKPTTQDVNWRGQVIKRGVKLWYVGTDTAKDLIYGRLMVTTAGPGYLHFSKHLPAAFFPGLTAESRVPQRTARGLEHRWVNTRRQRNEPLDCTVYAVFCIHMLQLHLYTDRMWAKREAALAPAAPDLFTLPPASDAAPVPPPVPGVPAVPGQPRHQPKPAPWINPAAKRPRGFAGSWK